MALNESPDEPFALVQPKAQPIRQERPAQPQTMAPGGGCNPALQQTPTDSKNTTQMAHTAQTAQTTRHKMSQTFLVNPLSYGFLRHLTPIFMIQSQKMSKMQSIAVPPRIFKHFAGIALPSSPSAAHSPKLFW
jgi:hypothetical protein